MDSADVCRLCGSSEGIKINIFEPGSNYQQKIHSLLPVAVHESDSLPQQICYRCKFKLNDFYEFREQCVLTDILLKKQLPWTRKGSGPPTCTAEMSMVNINDEALDPPLNQWFHVRQSVVDHSPSGIEDGGESSEEDDVEIVDVVNLKVSVSTSACEKSATDRQSCTENGDSTKINHSVSLKDSGNMLKRKKRKKKKRNYKLVSKTPDENENNNEKLRTDNNCTNNIVVNSSKSKNVLVIRKQSASSEWCTLSNTKWVSATKENIERPIVLESNNETSLKEVSKTCVPECTDKDNVNNINITGGVKQISENLKVKTSASLAEGNGESSKQTEIDPQNIIVTKIPGVYTVYTCAICERTFINKESADSHSCDSLTTVSNTSALEDSSYKCEICGQEFSRQATLSSHEKSHNICSSDEDEDDNDGMLVKVHAKKRKKRKSVGVHRKSEKWMELMERDIPS